MNKKIMRATLVIVFAMVAGYGANISYTNEALPVLMLDNVEALATPEQPNIKDCKSDPSLTCIALHPTNPSLDKSKSNARW